MKTCNLIILTILSLNVLHANTNGLSLNKGFLVEFESQCKGDGEACTSFLECCSHFCVDIINRCISFAEFQKISPAIQEVIKPTTPPTEIKEQEKVDITVPSKTNGLSLNKGFLVEYDEQSQCKGDGEPCNSFLECCSHFCIDIINRCISFAEFQKISPIIQKSVKPVLPTQIKEEVKEIVDDTKKANLNGLSLNKGFLVEYNEQSQCKGDGEQCTSFLECCSHFCVDIINRCISFAEFQKITPAIQ